MDTCLGCALGFCEECSNPTDDNMCCCPVGSETIQASNKRGGPTKEAEDITDVKSTGRKRAAVLFPITQGSPCEWRRLKFAGGGVNPVIGCLEGIASDRHHGPDKNTLNNTVGNVHRICDHCHNRWHTLNDPAYPHKRPDGDIPFIPDGEYREHDPITQATEEEVIKNDLYWFSKKKNKI